MLTRVFVYGTLKSGHGNNRLLRGSELVGMATTEEPMGFYGKGIPFMFHEPAEGHEAVKVRGELWDVDNETLKALDQLEGHPTWYRREITSLRDDYGNRVHAYAYFMQGDPSTSYGLPIKSGVF